MGCSNTKVTKNEKKKKHSTKSLKEPNEKVKSENFPNNNNFDIPKQNSIENSQHSTNKGKYISDSKQLEISNNIQKHAEKRIPNLSNFFTISHSNFELNNNKPDSGSKEKNNIEKQPSITFTKSQNSDNQSNHNFMTNFFFEFPQSHLRESLNKADDQLEIVDNSTKKPILDIFTGVTKDIYIQEPPENNEKDNNSDDIRKIGSHYVIKSDSGDDKAQPSNILGEPNDSDENTNIHEISKNEIDSASKDKKEIKYNIDNLLCLDIKESTKTKDKTDDDDDAGKKNLKTLQKEKGKFEEKDRERNEEEELENNIRKFKAMYERVKNNITENFDSTKTSSIKSEKLMDVVNNNKFEESSKNIIENYLNNQTITEENSNKLKILLGMYKKNIGDLTNVLDTINLNQKLDQILKQIEENKITNSNKSDADFQGIQNPSKENEHSSEVLNTQWEEPDIGDDRYKITTQEDEIFKTILEENSKNTRHEIISKQFIQDCRKTYADYKLFYESQNYLYNDSSIRTWVNNNKQDLTSNSLPDYSEFIFVVCSAVNLCFNVYPYPIQIINFIINIRTTSQNVLFEINTGEGKSISIAMVSLFLYFKHSKVDIITSSELLSKRDFAVFTPFFELFGVATGYLNTSDDDYHDSFESDVLYTTIAQLQFSYLYDILNKTFYNIRRNKSIIVVDEVDSMFIDGVQSCARIVRNIPGSQYLTFYYIIVNNKIKNISNQIIKFENKNYFLFESKVYEINDEVKFFKELLKHNFKNFVDCNYTVWFPEYLRENILLKNEDIHSSTICSILNKEINKDYVLENDRIVIVDYANTGVLQYGTSWQGGLHQFIELKHNIFPQVSNTTAARISNVTYFLKYQRLIGFTGTPGSQYDKEFLLNTYKMSCIKIPTNKAKIFIDQGGIICKSENEWIENICKNAILAAKYEKRCVLIINETIEFSLTLREVLLNLYNYDSSKIYLINKGSDKEIELIRRKDFCENEIIISTNISGRGTDIRLSPLVNEYGGMHVILSFLPSNSRVQTQAYGRTSRKGNPGTGIMIVNIYNYYNSIGDNFSIKTAIENREKNEYNNACARVNNLQNNLNIDSIFETFVFDINRVVSNNSIFSSIQLDELFYKWSLFLLKVEDAKLSYGELKEKYKQFKSTVYFDIVENNKITNPFLFVKCGLDLISSENYKAANECFNNAISLDEAFIENAYFYKAFCILNDVDLEAKDVSTCIEYLNKFIQINSEFSITKFFSIAMFCGGNYNLTSAANSASNSDPNNETTNIISVINRFIEFKHMKNKIATCLIDFLSKNGINVKISQISYLYHLFPDELPYIRSWESNLGFPFVYFLKYKKRFKWRIFFASVFVGIAGVAQLLGGVIFTMTPLIGLGFKMIGSGLDDLANALKIYRTGEFSWLGYFAKKLNHYAKSFSNPLSTGIEEIITGGGNLVSEILMVAGKKKLGKIIKNSVKIAKKILKVVNPSSDENDFFDNDVDNEINENDDEEDSGEFDNILDEVKNYNSKIIGKSENLINNSLSDLKNKIIEPFINNENGFLKSIIKTSKIDLTAKIKNLIIPGKSLPSEFNELLTFMNLQDLLNAENWENLNLFKKYKDISPWYNDIHTDLYNEYFKQKSKIAATFFFSEEIKKGYQDFFKPYSDKIKESFLDEIKTKSNEIFNLINSLSDYYNLHIQLYNKNLNQYSVFKTKNLLKDNSDLIVCEVFKDTIQNSEDSKLYESFFKISDYVKSNAVKILANKKLPSMTKFLGNVNPIFKGILSDYNHKFNENESTKDMDTIISRKKEILKLLEKVESEILNFHVDKLKLAKKTMMEGLEFNVEDLLKREEWKSHTKNEGQKIIDQYFAEANEKLSQVQNLLFQKIKSLREDFNNTLFDYNSYPNLYVDKIAQFLSKTFIENMLEVS